MSKQLTIDQFADHIRNSGNNAITYQHLNNSQLAEEWLKKSYDKGRGDFIGGVGSEAL